MNQNKFVQNGENPFLNQKRLATNGGTLFLIQKRPIQNGGNVYGVKNGGFIYTGTRFGALLPPRRIDRLSDGQKKRTRQLAYQ